MQNRQTISDPLEYNFNKLPYCEKDFHGNSPLLIAAQPKTRDGALENLKNAINAGTLKYQFPTPQNILSAPFFSGSTLFFTETQIAPDGNCGFTALNTNRATLVNTILQTANEQDREFLAEEIIEGCMTKEIDMGQIIADLIQDYDQASKDKDKVSLTVKEKIKHILPNEIAKMPAHEFLNWLQNYTSQKNEIDDVYYDSLELKNAIDEARDAKNKLINYCSTKEIFQAYLNKYLETNLWLGYRTATLYTKSINTSLYIWKHHNDGSTLKLAHYNVCESDKIVNLLHTSTHNHFNLLIEAPMTTFNDNNFLNDTNKYKDNLLHRAVRSIAADILVPYLLNAGFKDKVNEKNIYGKTAMHRAIKYFAEFREKIISQLSSDLKITEIEAEKNFFHIASVCFFSLLEAGANLWIKDQNNETPLDRARNLESFYKSSNPEINAKYPWTTPDIGLATKLSEYNSSNSNNQNTLPSANISNNLPSISIAQNSNTIFQHQQTNTPKKTSTQRKRKKTDNTTPSRRKKQ